MANFVTKMAAKTAARMQENVRYRAQTGAQATTKAGKAVEAASNAAAFAPFIKWVVIGVVLALLLVGLAGVSNGVATGFNNMSIATCFNTSGNSKLLTEGINAGVAVTDEDRANSVAKPPNACQGVGYNGTTYPPTTGVITTMAFVVDALHPNGHNGMDIADACDSPIYAFAGGEVTTVVMGSEGMNSAVMGVVIIKHTEEFSTVYYHTKGSTTTVQVGDIVDAGTQIATQWSNGHSTGCHLHLEMRENGVRIDPLPVLEAAGYMYSMDTPFTKAMLPPPPNPEAGTGQGIVIPAGAAQSIALNLVRAKGWSDAEFSNCLVPLWNRESNWRTTAQNNAFSPSSAPIPENQAYGIPQAGPGSKMASAGADWKTSASTQIKWGLGYIEERYGTPCKAWAHSEAHNWY